MSIAEKIKLEIAQPKRKEIIQPQKTDLPLTILPDRRELLLAPIGSFDTMTKSPDPRELGQANSNITIIQPSLASPLINHLPQNNVVREDSVVSYREVIQDGITADAHRHERSLAKVNLNLLLTAFADNASRNYVFTISEGRYIQTYLIIYGPNDRHCFNFTVENQSLPADI